MFSSKTYDAFTSLSVKTVIIRIIIVKATIIHQSKYTFSATHFPVETSIKYPYIHWIQSEEFGPLQYNQSVWGHLSTTKGESQIEMELRRGIGIGALEEIVFEVSLADLKTDQYDRVSYSWKMMAHW